MPGSAMPAAIRLFLAGNAVAMTGNGLVIAFTLIYLHQARGIALPIVGAPLAAAAAAGLLAVTVSGVLLDRLGGRRVLTGIILGQAVAQVLLAWAHNAATALPALLVYGATWAPTGDPDLARMRSARGAMYALASRT
jgi:predicted MFS family arabinose efflux permease